MLYFDLLTFVEQLSDKVLLTMLYFDLLTSVETLSDKVLCKMMRFDSSSSVVLTFKDEAAISVLPP